MLERRAALLQNGHVEEDTLPKKGRTKRELIICVCDFEEIQTKTRTKIRLSHQVKGRKWEQTNVEIFYVCGDCLPSFRTFLESGWL